MNPKHAGLWRRGGSIKSKHTGLAKALTDIYDGLNRWELWGTLGWQDIRHRYRRSIIGPFWITLSMGIMVGALGFLYSQFFGQPIREYLPFLALGIIIWGFISTLILDGCIVFIASESVIRQLRSPLSVYVFRVMWRNLIIFAHNMVIYLVIMLIFGIWPGTQGLLAIPGVVILCLNGIWASFLVGLLSARFRDIPMLAANIIQILFFFTPIIWNVEQLRSSKLVAELNPFYHLVEIVRMPLLGHAPPLSTWFVVSGVTVVGYLVALGFFVRFRARIAYWV
jgi:ABC-type polysaccharide/polyol phosphate export permease